MTGPSPWTASGVGAVLTLLLWLLVKRPLARVGMLEGAVTDLRDDKVAALTAGVAAAAGGRKALHEEITRIRTHFVDKEECKEDQDKMAGQFVEFRATVLKLERVSERTDQAVRQSREVLAQIINVKTDVAGLCAKVEALRDG